MTKSSAQMTAAEISRLAGVTRATVSNWRRRHQDFPAPSGGTDASPLYDVPAVLAWLDTRGHSSAASSAEELRSALRLAPGGSATRLLSFVLAAARRGGAETLTDIAALPAADLAARAQKAVADLADAVPAADTVAYTANDADLLRRVLHCVRDEGSQSALDVLAERELEDSAATGAYATPEPLTDLMARLLAPAGGPYPAGVLDPACGTGALLAAAARLGATHLYGQDVIPVQAQRTAVRLQLTAADTTVTVKTGDTLRADAFPDLTVDAVLCQPPYGDRDWGHDELAYDHRWAYGVPPRTESELAWNQHVLSHLAPGGQAVMLLPPAPASRTSGRRVRAELLRSGAVRAVIALRPGAASPLHIGLHLWVLQRPEPGGTDRERVLFLDTAGTASDLRGLADRGPSLRTDGGQNALDWNALTTLLLTHWRAFDADPAAFTDEPGIARAVPVIELLDDLTDITPARHVRAAPAAADPATVAKDASCLRTRLHRSVENLADAVSRTGWQPAGGEARSWRTATVADLARGGALTLHRAARGPADAEPPAAYAGLPVLTGHDIATGARASATADDQRLTGTVAVESGDVLLPAVVGSGTRPGGARVADDQDAGALLGPHVHLFRPDPDRLDPWFLAGFLSTEDNISSASTGSTSVQIDPRRLRLPLLPLAEQRDYGEAFRRLHELRTATARAVGLATKTAGLLTEGLTTGTLLPARHDTA